MRAHFESMTNQKRPAVHVCMYLCAFPQLAIGCSTDTGQLL